MSSYSTSLIAVAAFIFEEEMPLTLRLVTEFKLVVFLFAVLHPA